MVVHYGMPMHDVVEDTSYEEDPEDGSEVAFSLMG